MPLKQYKGTNNTVNIILFNVKIILDRKQLKRVLVQKSHRVQQAFTCTKTVKKYHAKQTGKSSVNI